MPPKRKIATKNAEKAAEEKIVAEPEESPKKRGRKAAPAKADDVAKAEEPPKRKGRTQKGDKKQEVLENADKEEESAPSPPKRSRRVKPAVLVEPEKPVVPATRRGRQKKTDTSEQANGESVEETKPEPAKRGRRKKTEESLKEVTFTEEGSLHEFKANTIKGKEVSLNKYKGHVCIVVNVASKCGHTKSNYEQFVQLYDKYSGSKGLRILAFPCNQFSSQEPGNADKICEFVEARNVKFDMFEKIQVNGKNEHPLWKWLKEQKAGPKGKDITWNFTKFIIDKEGKVVDRFQPTVKPLKLLETLEKLW